MGAARTTMLLRLGLIGLVAATVGACGSSSAGSNSTARLSAALNGLGENLFNGVRGGTLTVYNNADFQHLDPGEAYDVVSYEVVYATQRPLFSYPPNGTEVLAPDLASGPAIVSADGETVTVHIKRGVYFSAPVNREVTSSDVAYANERGANPNDANPSFPPSFSHIVGASRATGGPIQGIAT